MEFRGHGNQMVEDVGLDALELLPHFIGQEEVDLDRYAELTMLPLSNNQIQTFGYDGMMAKV